MESEALETQVNMIHSESVLATKDSFVVVNKINKPQFVRGYQYPTMMRKVLATTGLGLYLETKHFEIIASPQQKFIVSGSAFKEAAELVVGEGVLTSVGFEDLVAIIPFSPHMIPMASIFTDSKIFIANSFVLLSDY